MLRAHRQAWCWQDEYHGLQLSDIRKLEYETQLALQETMAAANEGEEFVHTNESSESTIKQIDSNDNFNTSSDSKHKNSPKIPVSKSNNVLKEGHQKSGSPAPSVSSRRSTKSKSKQLSRSKTSLGRILLLYCFSKHLAC